MQLSLHYLQRHLLAKRGATGDPRPGMQEGSPPGLREGPHRPLMLLEFSPCPFTAPVMRAAFLKAAQHPGSPLSPGHRATHGANARTRAAPPPVSLLWTLLADTDMFSMLSCCVHKDICVPKRPLSAKELSTLSSGEGHS